MREDVSLEASESLESSDALSESAEELEDEDESDCESESARRSREEPALRFGLEGVREPEEAFRLGLGARRAPFLSFSKDSAVAAAAAAASDGRADSCGGRLAIRVVSGADLTSATCPSWGGGWSCDRRAVGSCVGGAWASRRALVSIASTILPLWPVKETKSNDVNK